MKIYNLIKNIYLASATATLYHRCIVDEIGIALKWIATIFAFGLILATMTYADNYVLRKYRKRKKKVAPTMEKSA